MVPRKSLYLRLFFCEIEHTYSLHSALYIVPLSTWLHVQRAVYQHYTSVSLYPGRVVVHWPDVEGTLQNALEQQPSDESTFKRTSSI